MYATRNRWSMYNRFGVSEHIEAQHKHKGNAEDDDAGVSVWIGPGPEVRPGHPWQWQGSCHSGWRPTIDSQLCVPYQRVYLSPLPCMLHRASRWVSTSLTYSTGKP